LIDPSGLRNVLSARFAGDESIGMRRIRGEHHVVSSGEGHAQRLRDEALQA